MLWAVIEKVTGKPFKEALQQNILKLLNMMDCGFMSRTAVLGKRATGYRKTLAGVENAHNDEEF